MPFQAPGSLTSVEYYQLVAFLLRQNGLWDGHTEIDASNASQILISLDASTPVPSVPRHQLQATNDSTWMIFAGLGLSLILILFVYLIIRNKAKI